MRVGAKKMIAIAEAGRCTSAGKITARVVGNTANKITRGLIFHRLLQRIIAVLCVRWDPIMLA